MVISSHSVPVKNRPLPAPKSDEEVLDNPDEGGVE